ncbi:YfbM family protein [Lachnoanaerobaculum umeaense]|uniref:DUF1877 family protein n=1 Tax=Lachnoanaerobaculum umeaense TaxID=617123 RepID=A0A385Q0R9_9FIRM|nr:YfbM family protein [Lachnoanaerobaculum umeaense]AYA99746.1 DUF1877 family protein [Lachnoanaerobaculum umeaense]PZW97747.1 uncharacterized protein DUF1877 [Lachnoanaerobaculum umeaense]
MGLRANYQYLSDKDLVALKKFDNEDDIFETVEDWNDEAEILLDIDKNWDLLHYMLTGVSASDPIWEDPLSEAVVGVTSIEKIEDFIAYINKDRVSDILKALEDFDMESALESFSLEEGKEAELYPDIWDYDDEEEEIKEDLLDCFERMKEFYKEILEADGNVLVTIY